ncbi:serine hydrolase domain-containing protein [Deinococcus multiflagellatus]|uniref:serine hydrolase domain-containing protein n=1 Tax=Deinococcus multiflagellatus TaxID=1656887 RepID=UPI001CCDA189|nr:serine hydrolase domain-containing protein [Deinococcus multiflagellatus]MBZ9714146.1 beta-lactamase family protein [Deinococcus multiflagellatus]
MFRDPARAALRASSEVLGHDLTGLRPLMRQVTARGGVVAVARGPARAVHAFGAVRPGQGFELASVSKPFTAALVSALQAAGHLDWDRPLAGLGGPLRGLPPFITPRALATHTAGLPMHPARVAVTTFTRFHDPYGGMDPAAVVASARRWARPGGRFVYSNLGVGLLALAAAHAAGEAFSAAGYGRALARWVTGPLGLGVGLQRPDQVTAPPTGFGPLAGAGGLFGAAEDLLTFAEAQWAGRSASAWSETVRPPGLPPALSGVAPGWFARGPLRWHDGAARATRTALGFNAQSGAVAAVLVRGGAPLLGPRGGVTQLVLGLLG